MLTLQEAKNICKKEPKFYFKETIIDNYHIISFDYRDGTHYEDFKKHNAFELRGLTFVENKVYPMIHKFFNLGERYEGEVEECLSKKVSSIQIKEDGSLITFIMLPNGKIVAKTKMGFSNVQVLAANKWLTNHEESIRELLNNGYFPFFEYVSPDNKIVLEYDKEDLIFIQARKSDYSYASIEELKEIASQYGFTFKDTVNYSLSELLDLKETLDNVEGFIVRFEDDTFVKVKTDWYFKEHSSNEALSRLNELFDLFFETNSKEEVFNRGKILSYEKNILMQIFDLFVQENIQNKKDLQELIFDKQSNVRGKYISLYRKFQRIYEQNNSIDNLPGFITVCLDGRLDDFLPKVKNQQEVLEKEKKLFEKIQNSVQEIERIVKESSSRADIAKQLKGNPFIKLGFEAFEKKINIEERVIETIRENLNNKKFLSKLF